MDPVPVTLLDTCQLLQRMGEETYSNWEQIAQLVQEMKADIQELMVQVRELTVQFQELMDPELNVQG